MALLSRRCRCSQGCTGDVRETFEGWRAGLDAGRHTEVALARTGLRRGGGRPAAGFRLRALHDRFARSCAALNVVPYRTFRRPSTLVRQIPLREARGAAGAAVLAPERAGTGRARRSKEKGEKAHGGSADLLLVAGGGLVHLARPGGGRLRLPADRRAQPGPARRGGHPPGGRKVRGAEGPEAAGAEQLDALTAGSGRPWSLVAPGLTDVEIGRAPTTIPLTAKSYVPGPWQSRTRVTRPDQWCRPTGRVTVGSLAPAPPPGQGLHHGPRPGCSAAPLATGCVRGAWRTRGATSRVVGREGAAPKGAEHRCGPSRPALSATATPAPSVRPRAASAAPPSARPPRGPPPPGWSPTPSSPGGRCRAERGGTRGRGPCR